MTTTDTERHRRIAVAYGAAGPAADLEAIAASVDAELEAEAAERAEDEARGQALEDSFHRMTTCGCCRSASSIGARDGLCDACRPVVAELVTERRRSEVVNSRTRRELASAYVEARDKR
jgi:hypothetical protein